jgi:transcriptional regulator of acetoin/glycerol metabolism
VRLQLRIDEIGPGFLREAERAAILRALREVGGNVERAAALLGIGKSTMYRKVVEHEITEEERY